MSNLEFRDLSCFVLVAQAVSISAAARNSTLPKATISHRIRRLEDELGVDLFVRFPRKLELTDHGSRFLAHCYSILGAIDSATDDIKSSSDSLVGRLSVAVASEFGTSTVGPVLEEFARTYPKLKFDVEILSDYQVYFENLDIDCLIYVGEPPDTSLIGRCIWKFKFSLYAGSEYLEKFGAPNSIKDLSKHQCIKYLNNFQDRTAQTWQLSKGNKNVNLSLRGRLRSPNFWMVKFFTVANLGIAYLPDFFVETELDIGLVKEVLPGWHSEEVPVYALFPKYRHGSRKVSKFIELWQKKIGNVKSEFPFALVDPNEMNSKTRQKNETGF